MVRETNLIELDTEDCADLLASASLGRLAVIIEGHPEIYPVNHVIDRESGCIIFPSNAGSKLHAALSSPSVAFEADGVCNDGTRGWSVLVVGHAEEVIDPATIARLVPDWDRLWRAGPAARWIRIVPWNMTGRRTCTSDRAASLRAT